MLGFWRWCAGSPSAVRAQGFTDSADLGSSWHWPLPRRQEWSAVPHTAPVCWPAARGVRFAANKLPITSSMHRGSRQLLRKSSAPLTHTPVAPELLPRSSAAPATALVTRPPPPPPPPRSCARPAWRPPPISWQCCSRGCRCPHQPQQAGACLALQHTSQVPQPRTGANSRACSPAQQRRQQPAAAGSAAAGCCRPGRQAGLSGTHPVHAQQ